MNANPSSFRRYSPAVVMTLLIPVLSLLPAHFFKQVMQPLPAIPSMDKIVHALMYAALTAAYLYALAPDRRSHLAAVLRIDFLVALYGFVMEVCQKLFTNSRSMDPLDGLANTVGALACALTVWAWSRRVRVKHDVSSGSVQPFDL
ncbi:MAG: VanZ family protein [bacterium]